MKTKFYRILFISLFSFLTITLVFADSLPPRYGSEFTFTNDEMIKAGIEVGPTISTNPINIKLRDLWAALIPSLCPHCEITEGLDRDREKFFRVEDKENDFWFQISLDSWVVETQMKPMTLEEIKEKKDLLYRYVFGAAWSLGISPHFSAGGGHIHFDLQDTFHDDALLFRNFFVDYQNHPELSFGILGITPDNAPTLALLSQAARDNFTKVLKDFDSWDKQDKTIAKLAEKIQYEVYKETFMPTWKPTEKYQAINLTRIVNPKFPLSEKTMEIRGLRPQRSVEDYIQMLEIFEARLQYLKGINRPIEYQGVVIDIDKTNIFKVLGEQEIVDKFYIYLKEMNLDWNAYKGTMSWMLQKIEPRFQDR